LLIIYLAAFEDFLQTFKTSPQSALANALGDMNIDEDDFSDEYDFMDDDDEEGQNSRRQARSQAKQPKLKYADLLQKVADRYEDEITIDLDDLAKVGTT
jgi:DNA replication licensing factor MCM7